MKFTMDIHIYLVMSKIILVLALLLVASSCIETMKLSHRQRTPLENKMFIDYMNRGPLIQGVLNIVANLFPMNEQPNLYSYPEVKIYNYLDTQYYG